MPTQLITHIIYIRGVSQKHQTSSKCTNIRTSLAILHVTSRRTMTMTQCSDVDDDNAQHQQTITLRFVDAAAQQQRLWRTRPRSPLTSIAKSINIIMLLTVEWQKGGIISKILSRPRLRYEVWFR